MSARPVLRFLAVLSLVMIVSAPAAHARVFVSLGFPFFPFFGPAYYYPPAPAYYYPPPYYYPPQQSYYAPDAYGYGQAAPQSAPAPAQTVSPGTASKNCRTYRGDATIDASGKPFYGRACLEVDGHWHVVQQ